MHTRPVTFSLPQLRELSNRGHNGPFTLQHNCLVIPRDAEDGQEQVETCSPYTCATFEHDNKLEIFSK